jgi:RNA polymerase sigma-70 factor (ECF subfamily)
MAHLQSIRLWFGSIGQENFPPFRLLALLIIDQVILQDKPRLAPDVPRLTHQMVKGDEDAYRWFYDAYFSRLLGYLLVATGNEQLAREALQLTLLRVARNAKKFDSEEAFWSWLTVLARSSVTDESRRSSRYVAMLSRLFERRAIETDGQMDETNARFRELLEAQLAALPYEESKLIERKYFEGDSVREIARDIQVSEKAVESRLVRIRQKLRESVLSQLKHER